MHCPTVLQSYRIPILLGSTESSGFGEGGVGIYRQSSPIRTPSVALASLCGVACVWCWLLGVFGERICFDRVETSLRTCVDE
mmetsp:Transcript_21165/g.50206  ORF Transcript_21165/g.50206 Transcript_21165/m.50206 type:complete len:82 (+) Transcript_21165:97-342(+)